MATINGGGASINIPDPEFGTPAPQIERFHHLISEVQGASDDGARVEVYDQDDPPTGPVPEDRPFVMLVDDLGYDPSRPIIIPEGVDYIAIDDGVSADRPDKPITIQNTGNTPVTVLGGGGENSYEITGPVVLYDTAEFGTGFSHVHVRDAPAANGEVTGSEIHTGDGGDVITTGSGNDTVHAGEGRDLISLGAGDDVMFGVRGHDTIFAGSGNDTIEVAEGDVFAVNESGNLTLVAARDATVLGGSGSTTIYGGTGGGLFVGGTAGNNSMTAGEGATTLIGGGAGDILRAGGLVGDVLVAGAGNTTLIGGGADNTFRLGSGDDLVLGGPIGNETIIAGGGDDTVFGGGGFNLYSFVEELTSGGTLQITDFRSGFDKVHVEGYADNIETLIANQAQTEAGTSITLSDGTEISFLGLEELKREDFT